MTGAFKQYYSVPLQETGKKKPDKSVHHLEFQFLGVSAGKAEVSGPQVLILMSQSRVN